VHLCKRAAAHRARTFSFIDHDLAGSEPPGVRSAIKCTRTRAPRAAVRFPYTLRNEIEWPKNGETLSNGNSQRAGHHDAVGYWLVR
jgi:hypothetical protein